MPLIRCTQLLRNKNCHFLSWFENSTVFYSIKNHQMMEQKMTRKIAIVRKFIKNHQNKLMEKTDFWFYRYRSGWKCCGRCICRATTWNIWFNWTAQSGTRSKTWHKLEQYELRLRMSMVPRIYFGENGLLDSTRFSISLSTMSKVVRMLVLSFSDAINITFNFQWFSPFVLVWMKRYKHHLLSMFFLWSICNHGAQRKEPYTILWNLFG